MKTKYLQLAIFRISDTTIRDLGGLISPELSMWVIPDTIMFTLNHVLLAKRYDYVSNSSSAYEYLKTCIKSSIDRLHKAIDAMDKHNQDVFAINAYSGFIDGFNSDVKKLMAYLIPRLMRYLPDLIGDIPVESGDGGELQVRRCKYSNFYEFRVVQYETGNKDYSLPKRIR